MHPYELRCLDELFCLRYRLHGPQPQDPRIVLIGVDRKTFQRLNKPTVFWQGELATVIQGLLDSGAAAVGVDILISFYDSQAPGGLNSPEYDRVREDIILPQEARLVLPILSGKVVLGAYHAEGGAAGTRNADLPSRALWSAAAANDNIGYGNFFPDPDGTVRCVYYTSSEKTAQDQSQESVFALRLAELATGKRLTDSSYGLQLGDEPLVTETGEHPVLRINYPAPADEWGTSFPHYNFSDLLDRFARGEKLPEFEGALCILCIQDRAGQDYHATPFNPLSGRDSLGTEGHAAVLNTVLNRNFIHSTPAIVWWSVCLLLGALSGLATYRFPLSRSLLGSGLVLLIYLVVVEEVFSRNGLWLPVLAPIVTVLGATALAYGLRFLTIEKERRFVHQMFARLVSPQVLREVMHAPEQLSFEGADARISVLFSDINDFTPICERHTPQEVIRMLNRYFEEMVAIAFRNDAYIKQFVGDEIMLVFGAPRPQKDHAARAVKTGLEMLERLAQMKQEAGDQEGFFEVKIGINTGNVVLGLVGSSLRQEYAAVGDDVNLGARIESLTKKLGAQMLVSEATRNEAAEHLPDVEWISRGIHELKGKTTRLELFEVKRKEGPSCLSVS